MEAGVVCSVWNNESSLWRPTPIHPFSSHPTKWMGMKEGGKAKAPRGILIWIMIISVVTDHFDFPVMASFAESNATQRGTYSRALLFSLAPLTRIFIHLRAHKISGIFAHRKELVKLRWEKLIKWILYCSVLLPLNQWVVVGGDCSRQGRQTVISRIGLYDEFYGTLSSNYHI